MILKKSLRARYYIMAKIVTIFLFFSTILSIATPGIGEINDEKSKKISFFTIRSFKHWQKQAILLKI